MILPLPSIADRVALLDQGRVVWLGPVDALDIDGEKDGDKDVKSA